MHYALQVDDPLGLLQEGLQVFHFQITDQSVASDLDASGSSVNLSYVWKLTSPEPSSRLSFCIWALQQHVVDIIQSGGYSGVTLNREVRFKFGVFKR